MLDYENTLERETNEKKSMNTLSTRLETTTCVIDIHNLAF